MSQDTCCGDTEREARQAKVLTNDGARRIAINIERLPELLGKVVSDVPVLRPTVRSLPLYCADPIVSAIVAPRLPSGFSDPTVVSRAVWCSISELISAPTRMTIADIHIHVIVPIAAPSDP